jgi:hypothetical protein
LKAKARARPTGWTKRKSGEPPAIGSADERSVAKGLASRGKREHESDREGVLLQRSESCCPRRKSDVRVTTAFNRLVHLPGAAVIDVSFGVRG